MKKLLFGLGFGVFLLAGCTAKAPAPAETQSESMTTQEVAPAQETAMAPVTINLAAVKNSGQTGTATFEDMGGTQTRVTLNLTGGTFPLPQPAHVHMGSCAAPGDVAYPLTDVENGVSETVIDAPLSGLWNGDMMLNTHKSSAQMSVYTACGDMLSAAGGAETSDTTTPATEGSPAVAY